MPLGDIFQPTSALSKVVSQAKLSGIFNPDNYSMEDVGDLVRQLQSAAQQTRARPSVEDILHDLDEEDLHPDLSETQRAGWMDALATLGISPSVVEEILPPNLQELAEKGTKSLETVLSLTDIGKEPAKTSSQLRFDASGTDGSLEDKAMFAHSLATSVSNIAGNLATIADIGPARSKESLSKETQAQAKAVAKAILYSGEKLLEKNGQLGTMDMLGVISKLGVGNAIGTAIDVSKEIAKEAIKDAPKQKGKDVKVGTIGALSNAYQTFKTASKTAGQISEALEGKDIGNAAIAAKIAEEGLQNPQISAFLRIMSQKAKESPDFVMAVKDNIEIQLEKLKKKKPQLSDLITSIQAAAKEPTLANATKIMSAISSHKDNPSLRNAAEMAQLLSGLSTGESQMNLQTAEKLKDILVYAAENLITPEQKAKSVERLSSFIGNENAQLAVSLLEQAKDDKDVQGLVSATMELAANPSIEGLTKLATLSAKCAQKPESIELIKRISNSADMQILGTVDFTKTLSDFTQTFAKTAQQLSKTAASVEEIATPLLSLPTAEEEHFVPPPNVQTKERQAREIDILAELEQILGVTDIHHGKNPQAETKKSPSVEKTICRHFTQQVLHMKDANEDAESDSKKITPSHASKVRKSEENEDSEIEL